MIWPVAYGSLELLLHRATLPGVLDALADESVVRVQAVAERVSQLEKLRLRGSRTLRRIWRSIRDGLLKPARMDRGELAGLDWPPTRRCARQVTEQT